MVYNETTRRIVEAILPIQQPGMGKRFQPRSSAHLCQTWQVHQRQVEDVRAVYPQVDGELADALVLASDAEGLLLDLAADVVKVGVSLVDVQELAPLLEVAGRVGHGRVDELEDERPAGDDALAAWEEVAADDPVRGVG